MSSENSNATLFKEVCCDSVLPNEILDFLGKYGVRNLAYDSDIGQNPGYIFRGELDFRVPLQSSLERDWFKFQKDASKRTIAGLLDFEKENFNDFYFNATSLAEIGQRHGQRPIEQPEEDVFWWLSFRQHYAKKRDFSIFQGTYELLYILRSKCFTTRPISAIGIPTT